MLVAGSIWPEDLPTLAPLLHAYAGRLRTIMATHEIDEPTLQAVEANWPGLVLRYSQATPELAARPTFS